MDPAYPALRTPGFPSWPLTVAPATFRGRGFHFPREPVLAFFVAKSWTHKPWRWTPSCRRSHQVKVNHVAAACDEEKIFETMSEVLNIALSESSLCRHDSKSKKLVSQLKSAVKEAKDFAELADDGVKPHLWHDADVILVGPSRTGKTTLANFLAKLGLRAANYPLVPGEDIPQDLFHIERSKLALLTTEADALKNIRQDRMKRLGMASSSYAGLGSIRKELDWVKMLYTRNFTGFPVINTAKCTIAEAAALVLSHMCGGHVDADTTTRLVNLVSMLTHR